MNENPTTTQYYIKGKDVPPEDTSRIWNEIIEAGRASFVGTTLIEPGEIGAPEITAIHAFFDQVSKINPDIFNTGLQEHIHLTAHIIREIGQILNDNGEHHNLDELEALGLLHDLGRTFSHRKGRNEHLARVLAQRIGIKEELLFKLPPDEIFNPKDALTTPPDEVDTQIIDLDRVIKPHEYRGFLLIADILGKRNQKTNALRRWEDVYEDAHAGKKPGYNNADKWPSEKNRMTETLRLGHIEAVNSMYKKLAAWAEERLGISLDDLVNRVETNIGG